MEICLSDFIVTRCGLWKPVFVEEIGEYSFVIIEALRMALSSRGSQSYFAPLICRKWLKTIQNVLETLRPFLPNW